MDFHCQARKGNANTGQGEKSSSSLLSVLSSLTSLFQTSTANKSFLREREKQIARAKQLRCIADFTVARKALAAAVEINHDHVCDFIEVSFTDKEFGFYYLHHLFKIVLDVYETLNCSTLKYVYLTILLRFADRGLLIMWLLHVRQMPK